jgi:hypothetical protein
MKSLLVPASRQTISLHVAIPLLWLKLVQSPQTHQTHMKRIIASFVVLSWHSQIYKLHWAESFRIFFDPITLGQDGSASHDAIFQTSHSLILDI